MRAPTFVTVRLEAALVAQLRQACHLVGDSYSTPPRTPQERARRLAALNGLAVDCAVRAFVRQKAAYRAELNRGAR